MVRLCLYLGLGWPLHCIQVQARASGLYHLQCQGIFRHRPASRPRHHPVPVWCPRGWPFSAHVHIQALAGLTSTSCPVQDQPLGPCQIVAGIEVEPRPRARLVSGLCLSPDAAMSKFSPQLCVSLIQAWPSLRVASQSSPGPGPGPGWPTASGHV